MKNFWKTAFAFVLLASLFSVSACVTTKKKGQEISKSKVFYHSFTNKYNYWFNADELFRLTTAKLEEQYQDNYAQILEVYPGTAADPSSVRSDLDNVIQKAAKGISLHRPGRWTDDNYGLIGRAQFLKRDYETAEATFKFIREEQDPRRFSKSKLKSSKNANKKKAAAQKKAEAKKKAKAKKKAQAKKKKEMAKNKKKGKNAKQTSQKDIPKTGVLKTNDSEELKLTGKNPYDQPFGRTHDYPSSMVWYGRTLTAREKYDEAEFLFRELWEDRFFPRDKQDELATAEANMYLKRKQYDKAIPALNKAIELSNSRKIRARLAYILAQIYDQAGQHEEAFAAYGKVLDNNPPYEMEFNARLQQIASGWGGKKTSSTATISALEKLANDRKNVEYRDQIYFTMAKIALSDGKKKEGIDYLHKSLSYNQKNTAQRAEAYLTLADLYFESEQFVLAKTYYDSTITVLPATDARFKRATDYANNLKDIARLIQTIEANDSIVRIFNMSDAERREMAKKIKKQRDEAEAEAIRAAAAQAPAAAKAPTPQAGQKPSTFYFYNETFLKKGRKDFSRIWGDRKLEDNWRRSNRLVTGALDEAAKIDSTQADTGEIADLKDIFANIPKSEAELSVIHLATYEAMYQLGVLFREKLDNNIRCSGTLEDMLARYPDTLRYEKEAWYYCYLAFTDLKNREKAQYYYDKLIEKYPKSAYARTLTDPNFLNASKERERELNRYYQETYALFQKGSYKEAYDRCQDAPKKFGSQNPIAPKFVLLSAMCMGNLNGNEAYCTALGDVIGRYPESAEATRAREIARLLSCKGFETDDKKKPEQVPGGDDPFMLEDDKVHYLIVALSGDNVRLDDIKVAISDYNNENHKNEQLRISNIFLGTDTNTPIVVIRKFDNKNLAMRYYNEVKTRKDFLGETDKKKYNKEMFAVTQENYRRILKNKTLDGYREFFEQNYLK